MWQIKRPDASRRNGSLRLDASFVQGLSGRTIGCGLLPSTVLIRTHNTFVGLTLVHGGTFSGNAIL